MIFPAAMRGLNAGHFPYDPLPDTTLSGGTTTTTSMMTNGNVSAVTAPPAANVSTTMTNGHVSASGSQNGVTHPDGHLPRRSANDSGAPDGADRQPSSGNDCGSFEGRVRICRCRAE